VVLQVPLLRQAIAWQLCHRQLMHQQIRLAAEQLKAELAADDVRDLQVCRLVGTSSCNCCCRLWRRDASLTTWGWGGGVECAPAARALVPPAPAALPPCMLLLSARPPPTHHTLHTTRHAPRAR
jgi:hypothetical protein